MLSRKGKLKHEDYTHLPEAGFAAVQESEIGKTSKNVQFLTNEDITAQALIFFFGGFDTASSLMCFLGHELAVNQHIQRRLKEEIRKLLIDTDGKITYEHLLSMKYLDMVISETLRKWPQATWLDRKCTKEFEIEPKNEGEPRLKVNVGDICWLPVYAIHKDPNYYPNPDVFDPERFSDENKDKIKPTTYLPFGIGPRNCIGSRFALLETKILMFHLLTNFDIVPTEKTQIPLKIDKNNILVLGEKGFHVGLRRMQKTDFSNK
ncbi:p450 domain containing protein [Asbolus verrucosus]|uniref:p450 domain containing protein n=1 Tax=Asbolus verrucosus TaxID=1661398 RepID=A0A482VCC9_ASBVE|nr:p450 domain containing protein [Asbolus verrucosus]